MPPSAIRKNVPIEAAPLSKRVALVTGASRGIGFAIAQRLAGLGASLAICSRQSAALESAKGRLERSGAHVFSQPADVSQAADVAAFVKNAQAALGSIAILVNNAGIGLFGPAHEKSEAEWDRVLTTNLKSVFLMSRAVVPSMITRGSGDIINISSLAGRNTFAGGGLYCASKWGLQGLSGCMAEDLREHGIRVSVVSPGSVATDFSSHPKDPAKALLPEDVAHAVAMIVTQRSPSFVSEVQLRPLRKP